VALAPAVHVYLKGYADGHEEQAGIGSRFAFYDIARPAHADGCLARRDQQWIPRYDCGHDAALGQRFGVPHAHSRNNSNSTLRLDQFMRSGRLGGQIGSAINAAERLVIFRGRYGSSYCLGRHRISPPCGSRWTRFLDDPYIRAVAPQSLQVIGGLLIAGVPSQARLYRAWW
jgi:hypothetical protein